jgi:hypothetical protein
MRWGCPLLDAAQQKGFLPGSDGADWVIEASNDGRYQVIDAWSPPTGDPANILGRFMLFDLADLHLSDNEVYWRGGGTSRFCLGGEPMTQEVSL